MAAFSAAILTPDLPRVSKSTARAILAKLDDWMGATFITHEMDGLSVFQLDKTDAERAALTAAGQPATAMPNKPVCANIGSKIAVSLYTLDKEYFAAFQTAYGALRAMLVTSLGEEHIQTMRGEANAKITVRDMFLYIRETFAAPSAVYREELLQQMGTCFPTADFSTHIGTFTKITSDLVANGWAINDVQRMAHLVEATKHHPSLAHIIGQYHTANLRLDDRNYADMLNYIRLSLANNSVGTVSGIASVAIGAKVVNETDIARIVAEAVRVALAKASPAQPAASAKPVTTAPNPIHYCYYHGHGSHPGSVCKCMLGAPARYTPAMLNAKTPSAVSGGSTNQYGAARQ